MKLHTLKPAKGAVKSKNRVGRGVGSGRGGTSTRGNKGQQSRSGYKTNVGFEGGQMPIQRRVPKRGFKSRNRIDYKVFNLDDVSDLTKKYELKSFSVDTLYENGIIGKTDRVKVLGDGELSVTVDFNVNAVSKKAKEAIEKSNSNVELI